MSREWFDQQLGRMFVLRGSPDDSAEYWTAMQAVPDVVIEHGVTLAIRTRTWFPTPAELLQDCDTARPRTPEPAPEREVSADSFTAVIKNPFGGADLKLTVDRVWKFYCDDCRDTGQRSWWCGHVEDDGRKPWYGIGHCGRRGEHGSHEYVARCACWQSNPELIRKRAAADVKYADARQAS